MRYSNVFVSTCLYVCVCLCRWRWLNERASCLRRDDLHRADGSVSQSLRSQSCPTLLLTPHLTADFLPAHHKPTKTHTRTDTHAHTQSERREQRQQFEAADRRDEHRGREACKTVGHGDKTNLAGHKVNDKETFLCINKH